jgi:hypothetical protein
LSHLLGVEGMKIIKILSCLNSQKPSEKKTGDIDDEDVITMVTDAPLLLHTKGVVGHFHIFHLTCRHAMQS